MRAKTKTEISVSCYCGGGSLHVWRPDGGGRYLPCPAENPIPKPVRP